MTWSMEASGSEQFEPNARSSVIYGRDPFDDDEEENLENGEFDEDEDELDEDEDEDDDDFDDDDDDYDDDDEEDEEEEEGDL